MVLTNSNFRVEVIKYLEKHWKETDIAQIARYFGYKERYFGVKFKECFQMPFMHYLKKLKLRKFAMRMLEQNEMGAIIGMSGYAYPQNFSKAFRNEFGMSPRQFLYSVEELPDMPINYEIEGAPVTVEYVNTEEIIMHGFPDEPSDLEHTNFRKEIGYYFAKNDKRVDLERKTDQIGMLCHDEQCQFRYIMGPVVKDDKEAPAGMIKVKIPPRIYAIVSVDIRGNDAEQIYGKVRRLTDFVFEEWRIVNNKKLSKMEYIFEYYSEEKASLYLPVQRRNPGTALQTAKEKGVGAWIDYIDENIANGITVRSLARHFNYSEQHYSDTFALYYSITPGLYIEKRKLYLAATELRHKEADVTAVVEKYGFRSENIFRKKFVEEFQVEPEEYDGEEYRAEDLMQYYSSHKDVINITYVETEELVMMGKNILPSFAREHDRQDLTKYIVYILDHDVNYDIDFTSLEEANGENNRVVVWQTVNETGEQGCYIGPEIENDYQVPDGFRKLVIKGGSYVVLESLQNTDSGNLRETYQMLYRCAFSGWIKENRPMVDWGRITFVRYAGEKLRFHIPINN